MTYGAIMGEGLWKFNEFQRRKKHDVFNLIFAKSVQFLTLRKRGSKTERYHTKKLNKDEDLVVNANFYNEALENPLLALISFLK